MYGPDRLPRWPKGQWDTFFAGYLNFVVADGAVITAQFGDTAKDDTARATIERAFGDRTCVQLDPDRLHGHGGGGAHCVTMQQPRC